MQKILILLLAGVLILSLISQPVNAGEKDSNKGTITVSGAWAWYPMAVKWAQEFKKVNPDVRIDISAGGAGKGMADAIAGVVDIGMVSREINPAEVKKGAWGLAVAKDAVVPVININNPWSKTLLARGVKRDTFVGIWITETVKTWGQVLGSGSTAAVHVYTRSDACGAAETWAKYLGKKQEDLAGIGVYGDPGLADAVKKDVLGIGYNNVNFVYDGKTKKQVPGVSVLPIDVNANGKIDKDEDFYADRDQLTKAIDAGKYPSPPARALYFVCKGKPQNKLVADFLKWVLTDGQKFVIETGFIKIDEKRIKEELKNFE